MSKGLIARYIIKLVAFARGETRNCPACGTLVTSAILYAHIEPGSFSLYVEPCGCRLGTWAKAPDWITDVTIVPVEK